MSGALIVVNALALCVRVGLQSSAMRGFHQMTTMAETDFQFAHAMKGAVEPGVVI